MSGFSNHMAQAVINHFLRNISQTPPAALYLALFTGDPTDVTATALSQEIVAGWYARQLIQFEAPSDAADVETANTNTCTFNAVATATVTATNWGIFDASTNGNLMCSAAFDAPRVYNVDDVPKVLPGDITLNFI